MDGLPYHNYDEDDDQDYHNYDEDDDQASHDYDDQDYETFSTPKNFWNLQTSSESLRVSMISPWKANPIQAQYPRVFLSNV